MAPDSVSGKPNTDVVHIPVARLKALTRAMLWSVAAVIPGIAAVTIYGGLEFTPSGVSSRIVDYGIALCVLPVAAVAVWSAVKAARWLLLSAWPGALGVYAGEDVLILRLGSFGIRRYDADGLEVRYPFELTSELEDGGFEAFLPEEKQRSSLLPRITHAEAEEPLNLVILRYAVGTEAELAGALRPLFDRWRQRGLDGTNPAGRE